MPPLAANVILGAVWAVWHAPLWTVPGTVQSQIDFHVWGPEIVNRLGDPADLADERRLPT